MATEQCKKNRISMEGVVVKPSKEVSLGDVYTIRKNQIDYQIEVIGIPENRMAAKWVSMYYRDITPAEEKERLKLRQSEFQYYRAKGEGRPTKKDRRDLDDFWETEE